MSLELLNEDGAHTVMAVCDVCGQVIANLGLGAFTSCRPLSDNERAPLILLHKRGCTDAWERAHAGVVGWQELSCLARELGGDCHDEGEADHDPTQRSVAETQEERPSTPEPSSEDVDD